MAGQKPISRSWSASRTHIFFVFIYFFYLFFSLTYGWAEAHIEKLVSLIEHKHLKLLQ
jgi:hypothetical protein